MEQLPKFVVEAKLVSLRLWLAMTSLPIDMIMHFGHFTWVSFSLTAYCPESQLCLCQCIWSELLPCCILLSSLRYRGGSQEKMQSIPTTTADYVYSNAMTAYLESKKDALVKLVLASSLSPAH
jgi:hypothetical protein